MGFKHHYVVTEWYSFPWFPESGEIKYYHLDRIEQDVKLRYYFRKDDELARIKSPDFNSAANGGDSQRELVATVVVTSIILFAGGGVGIEACTIKYIGEEYGIVSVAVGGGIDISGGGRVELMKYGLSGNFSRRINHKHRLIYSIEEDLITVQVLSLWGHYED